MLYEFLLEVWIGVVGGKSTDQVLYFVRLNGISQCETISKQLFPNHALVSFEFWNFKTFEKFQEDMYLHVQSRLRFSMRQFCWNVRGIPTLEAHSLESLCWISLLENYDNKILSRKLQHTLEITLCYSCMLSF